MPFASGNRSQVVLVVSNNGRARQLPAAQVGAAELFEAGPTSYSWLATFALLSERFRGTFSGLRYAAARVGRSRSACSGGQKARAFDFACGPRVSTCAFNPRFTPSTGISWRFTTSFSRLPQSRSAWPDWQSRKAVMLLTVISGEGIGVLHQRVKVEAWLEIFCGAHLMLKPRLTICYSRSDQF